MIRGINVGSPVVLDCNAEDICRITKLKRFNRINHNRALTAICGEGRRQDMR